MRAVSNGIDLFVVVVVVLVKHRVTDLCISRAKRELSLVSGADGLP